MFPFLTHYPPFVCYYFDTEGKRTSAAAAATTKSTAHKNSSNNNNNSAASHCKYKAAVRAQQRKRARERESTVARGWEQTHQSKTKVNTMNSQHNIIEWESDKAARRIERGPYTERESAADSATARYMPLKACAYVWGWVDGVACVGFVVGFVTTCDRERVYLVAW